MKRWFKRVQLALIEARPTGLLLPMMLTVLVMGSALWAVRIKHENRSLTTEIERTRVERERLQMEWSQLRLEEAALSHHARIEAAARMSLAMAEPRDYVIVEQASNDHALGARPGK